jgi:hypothetical protein
MLRLPKGLAACYLDLLRESQQYGIRVCADIAQQNIQLIEGKVSDPGPMFAPVVDRKSGFGVVPDVFCVSLAIRPPIEGDLSCGK